MRNDGGLSKKQYKLNNGGFSLLELLVSIIILLLIMVPLMNNFVRSVMINDEAANIEEYSNVASDVIEDIKSMNLADLGKTTFPYHGNQLMDNGDGTFSAVTSPALQIINYFGLERQPTNRKYDVLVTIRTDSYAYESPTPAPVPVSGGSILMNNYPMPDINAVDVKVNGMYFAQVKQNGANSYEPTNDLSNSLDSLALTYFYDKALLYVEEQFRQYSPRYAAYLLELDDYQTKCREAEMKEEPMPVAPAAPSRFGDSDKKYKDPDYCKKDEIRKWMTKKIYIDISDEDGKTTIDYTITYECSWESEDETDIRITNSISYPLGRTTYGSEIQNIYLFYLASLFEPDTKDTIIVTDSNSATRNLFIVNQSGGSSPTINVNRPANVNLYTNLGEGMLIDISAAPATTAVDYNIITSTKKNRIYLIEVKVYRFHETNKYQGTPIYALESNVEE